MFWQHSNHSRSWIWKSEEILISSTSFWSESKTHCVLFLSMSLFLGVHVKSNSAFSFPTSVWMFVWFFMTYLLIQLIWASIARFVLESETDCCHLWPCDVFLGVHINSKSATKWPITILKRIFMKIYGSVKFVKSLLHIVLCCSELTCCWRIWEWLFIQGWLVSSWDSIVGCGRSWTKLTLFHRL